MVRVRCPRCGYVWDYCGGRIYVKCPRCLTTFSLRKHAVDASVSVGQSHCATSVGSLNVLDVVFSDVESFRVESVHDVMFVKMCLVHGMYVRYEYCDHGRDSETGLSLVREGLRHVLTNIGVRGLPLWTTIVSACRLATNVDIKTLTDTIIRVLTEEDLRELPLVEKLRGTALDVEKLSARLAYATSRVVEDCDRHIRNMLETCGLSSRVDVVYVTYGVVLRVFRTYAVSPNEKHILVDCPCSRLVWTLTAAAIDYATRLHCDDPDKVHIYDSIIRLASTRQMSK